MSEKETSLKRCPFCGAEAELMKDDSRRFISAVCKNCGARTGFFYNEVDATYMWNRRVEEYDDGCDGCISDCCDSCVRNEQLCDYYERR